jgi:Icc protein
MASEILLAQLTDLHLSDDPSRLVADVDPDRALQAALTALPVPPDVLVLTGDLADDGSRAAYERIDALTAGVATQRHAVPGNHDDPAMLANVLGSGPGVSVERLSDAWSLALVDSFCAHHIGGRVDHETVDQLDTLLEGHRNVVVALHHPLRPPCGFAECSLEGADMLERMLAKHAVRLVISGHLHQPFDLEFDGMRHFGALSTLRELVHAPEKVEITTHWSRGDGPVGGAMFHLRDNGDVVAEPILSTAS